MMNDFFLEFREQFPEFTIRADLAYIKQWNETVEPEFIFSWFERVAYVLNDSMKQGEAVAHYMNLLEYFSSKYQLGTADEKDCIDKAIVECLFWKVAPEYSFNYWNKLPKNLQQLYTNFFGKSPMEYYKEGF